VGWMTKESIFPKQAKNKGITLKELFEDLIKQATE
jgi:D-alanine-D-alanine ligase-like ATP-grasp enzyme